MVVDIIIVYNNYNQFIIYMQQIALESCLRKKDDIMSKNTTFHGSDLEKIESIYGIPKEQITNFAANVNPLGLSDYLKTKLCEQIDIITKYPDRNYTKLRQSIAAYCNAVPEHVVVGNGSTELISIMAQYMNPKKALILSPTYSEYEREIGLSGGKVDYFELKASDNFELNVDKLARKLQEHYDLFVICNPNNPTSSALSKDTMAHIFALCKEADTFVVVDETYVEFAPNAAKISCVSLSSDYDNFICLRGVSKFYAAPGLRLGYAITSNAALLELIHIKQNPWTVNSLAAAAGVIMYEDTQFQQKTLDLIHKEQQRMYEVFSESSRYKPYKANANFILLQIMDPTLNSDILFDHAIKNGCMIRNCSSFPFLEDRFIRFCFMNPEDNDKLVDILLDENLLLPKKGSAN